MKKRSSERSNPEFERALKELGETIQELEDEQPLADPAEKPRPGLLAKFLPEIPTQH